MKFEEALEEASKNTAPEPDVCVWPTGAAAGYSPVPFGLGIPGRLHICTVCSRWSDKCECKEPIHSTHAYVITPPEHLPQGEHKTLFLPQPECVNGKRVFGRRVHTQDAHLGAVGE